MLGTYLRWLLWPKSSSLRWPKMHTWKRHFNFWSHLVVQSLWKEIYAKILKCKWEKRCKNLIFKPMFGTCWLLGSWGWSSSTWLLPRLQRLQWAGRTGPRPSPGCPPWTRKSSERQKIGFVRCTPSPQLGPFLSTLSASYVFHDNHLGSTVQQIL
jgi:hypothetical protein